jgi:hypothetical protein
VGCVHKNVANYTTWCAEGDLCQGGKLCRDGFCDATCPCDGKFLARFERKYLSKEKRILAKACKKKRANLLTRAQSILTSADPALVKFETRGKRPVAQACIYGLRAAIALQKARLPTSVADCAAPAVSARAR